MAFVGCGVCCKRALEREVSEVGCKGGGGSRVMFGGG